MTPASVGGLAFVTAVVVGFGVIVIGNDLGLALANPEVERSRIWRPLAIFLCLPISAIVGLLSFATVTGSRRPASTMASMAVMFGTAIGAGSGRVVWRFIEIQTYGEVQGLLDSVATLVLAGSALTAGVAGSIIGDQFRSHALAKRSSQWSSIVATALIAYPTMELIAARRVVGDQQLWMLAFMLLALGLAPRIGLFLAEGDDAQHSYDLNAQRDNSAAVRLTIGFAAGWMTSMLVHMSELTYDGQLGRYALAWILPVVLAAPGVLAHLDRIGGRSAKSLQA